MDAPPTGTAPKKGDADPRSAPGQVARAAGTFVAFGALGLHAFGGPAAHLAHFREQFVVRRAWLSEAQLARMLALCTSLPGPTSSQVGFLIGWSRAGLAGALLAWFAFTAPSAIALATLAIAFGAAADPASLGWMRGLEAVVVAVVLHAVIGMSRAMCRGALPVAIAACAGAITLLADQPLEQVAAIGAGAALGALFLRAPVAVEAGAHPPLVAAQPTGRPRRGGEVHIGTRTAVFAALLAAALIAWASIADSAMASSYVRSGALVFGGGHVVLPLLEQQLVPDHLNAEHFLSGYAATQAMPGPLFSIAAFLGAAESLKSGAGTMASCAGAAAATAAIFAPGLALAVAAWPAWDRLTRIRAAMGAIAGVQAAVTGLLAAALIDTVAPAALAPTGQASLGLCAIAGVAAIALRRGAAPWLVVAMGALAGAALGDLR